MTKRLMAVAMSIALLAGTPAAHAAGARRTDPVARPRTVYPYVAGGRPDAAVITFTRVPLPTLTVYSLTGERRFRTRFRSGQTWNPRTQGDVLGTDLTDDQGRTFRLCVNRRGTYTVGSHYCTKVTVVHVREDVKQSRKRFGRLFVSKDVDPGCRVRRQNLAVTLDCDVGSVAVVRYDLKPPRLSNEQTFVVGPSFAWKGLYWHWGGGLHLAQTIRGANVTARGGFDGRLSWIKKIWTVRTEY